MAMSTSRSEPAKLCPTGALDNADLSRSIAATIETLENLSEILDDQDSALPDDVLRRLLTVAVRLYANAIDFEDREITPVDQSINTTQAVAVAVALLRAQGLTAFDTALWFARFPATTDA
jgi:hypothetical protein